MTLPSLPRFTSWIFALAASVSLAQAGSPRTNVCYPSGGQRGTEVDVTISGSNLKDTRDLLFDEPGFQATGIEAEAGKIKAKIKIDASARLGEHRYRIITNSGVSDVKLFYVSPFPLVEEQEDKANPKKLQPIALGTTVYGRTQGEDQDHFVVEAKKGQRITAEAVAVRLQSGNVYDSALEITKEDGTLLTESDDTTFGRQDPVASLVAPEDGKYVITIRDGRQDPAGDKPVMTFKHSENTYQLASIWDSQDDGFDVLSR